MNKDSNKSFWLRFECLFQKLILPRLSSVLLLFLLKCRFSRPRKYLVLFSPSLYHLTLPLIIALFVLYSTIFSSSHFFSFSLSSTSDFLEGSKSVSSSASNRSMSSSSSFSLLFKFFVFLF